MKLYLEIFLLFVLPVLLIVGGFIPLNQRGIVLITIVVLIVLVSITEKIPLKTLGIRTDNLKKSFVPYFLFTLAGAIGLFILSQILDKSPLPEWWTYSHLQWAFLPISIMQEFGYRAFLQTKLQKLLVPWQAILLTTLLYSGMHILWKDPLIILMTFIGGLGWGYLWYKYPNLYLISISHTVLNFLAIYFNFFPWLVTDFFSWR